MVRLSLLTGRHLRPQVAIGDLDQVSGGVVKVEGPLAAVPFLLVGDLDAGLPQMLTPGVIRAWAGLQAGVTGARGAVVGDRPVALGKRLAVEQQEDAGADPERHAAGPPCDYRQA